jgi:hypothetical protein
MKRATGETSRLGVRRRIGTGGCVTQPSKTLSPASARMAERPVKGLYSPVVPRFLSLKMSSGRGVETPRPDSQAYTGLRRASFIVK